MKLEEIKQSLSEKGYVVIPNILTEEEVRYCKKHFKDWLKTNYPRYEEVTWMWGIIKSGYIAHQRHAWYIRTRKTITNIFKGIWDCEKLVVSFDGSNYMSKSDDRNDIYWTHTDQSPAKKGLHCYQGMVTLTDNKERTLVVYEGSHKLHEKYFADRGIETGRDFKIIDEKYINSIQHLKKALHIPAGALVIWDSRTFHQNRYGKPNSEERIAQYVCYFPDNHEKNTEETKKKRLEYFKERRTTTHWPCPIVPSHKVDDPSGITKFSQLDDLMPEIIKLL